MVFHEGKNCWKVATAKALSFLIDGEDYFRALAEVCEKAQRAIYIIGWDIDSRIRLRRGGVEDESLAAFVDRLARSRPNLHVHLLEWDFALFYSLERENWPLLKFDWQTHERVHFALDGNHPAGASHHQKIVVVDDRIAFVGGFDLASCRWDTTEHRPDHPLRRDNGKAYGPFHDVQAMLEGPAAKALGVLARRRWEHATGEHLPTPEVAAADYRPGWVPRAVDNSRAAILRTEPAHDGRAEVREVEAFYLNAIARARTFIYIENQYLTAQAAGTALEHSLARKDGPEVLIVVPQQCSGWLEQETMGVLREQLLHRLRAADTYHRLKICYPHNAELAPETLQVHSKILIVDDALLTIGSANLSNRSMGLDTECNLALADDDHPALRDAIAGLRNRLLAEHLGTSPDKVADAIENTGSLLRAVQNLSGNKRTLRDLPPRPDTPSEAALSVREWADPERPVDLERLLDHFGIRGNGEADANATTGLRRLLAVCGTLLVLAGLWRWSPLANWLDLERLLMALGTIREAPMSVPITLGIYVLGSCLMVPLTLLILATALSFGPYESFALALAGSLLGGLAGYLAGRWLGRDLVRRLAGKRLNRLSRKLARHGWLAVALIRLVPVAPYTLVNLVAGSSHLSARDFLLGSAVGLIPGILAIILFGESLQNMLHAPGWQGLGLALAALVVALLALVGGRYGQAVKGGFGRKGL